MIPIGGRNLLDFFPIVMLIEIILIWTNWNELLLSKLNIKFHEIENDPDYSKLKLLD